MGKNHQLKDKLKMSAMPPSKEMEKNKRYPYSSALDIVKALGMSNEDYIPGAIMGEEKIWER